MGALPPVLWPGAVELNQESVIFYSRSAASRARHVGVWPEALGPVAQAGAGRHEKKAWVQKEPTPTIGTSHHTQEPRVAHDPFLVAVGEFGAGRSGCRPLVQTGAGKPSTSTRAGAGAGAPPPPLPGRGPAQADSRVGALFALALGADAPRSSFSARRLTGAWQPLGFGATRTESRGHQAGVSSSENIPRWRTAGNEAGRGSVSRRLGLPCGTPFSSEHLPTHVRVRQAG